MVLHTIRRSEATTWLFFSFIAAHWQFGFVVGRINAVTHRRAPLVIGCVTVHRRVIHLCM